MRFEFATATRIVFGPGASADIGVLARPLGTQALVVTGRSPQRWRSLLDCLTGEGIAHVICPVQGEPTTAMVQQGTEQARRAACQMVIGIGGGSVIDAGKAIAAMLANPGEVLDYLEVVGNGQALQQASVPYIAVPTTAGTGAEVTRNAVLLSSEHSVKVSMRSAWMLPHISLVDPLLTHSLPPDVTASTGLDALTQLLEVYVSKHANPLTDGICREGLRRVGRSLLLAYENGSNGDARYDMSLASLFGGLVLANAKLGAVHGLAGPLGGRFGIPHGVVCARLLPYVMEANVHALEKQTGSSEALARYDEVSQLLTGRGGATASDGVSWVQALCERLTIPPLSEYGVSRESLASVVEMSQKSSSMQGNPVALGDAKLIELLEQAATSIG